MAEREHNNSPCPHKRKAIKEVLVYAFSPNSCTERLRDKLADVVAGKYLIANK